MRRSIRLLLALPMLALIGCGSSTEPVQVPDADAPQYGPGAGSDATDVGPTPDDSLADPGQPPVEEDVPTGAGGPADVDEEPGVLSINPPRDLENQAPAPEPAPPSGDNAPAPDTPTADEPEEPGAGQP